MPMDSSPLLANHEQNQSKSGSLYCDIRILQEIFSRFKNIQVDPGEFACLKAVSLFKPGKPLAPHKSLMLFFLSAETI